MYNNPNILNVGWWWSSFISLSDLLALWNLQGLVIQLANKIPAALKGRKLVAMSDFGLSIPLVPTNPWIPPAISLSDVVRQEQHRSRFSNFTCGSVTLNSRWQLESPELNWTAADFIRQQQTLVMQGCQWYQECEETMKSSTTSMQASLHNKTGFRWTVFCSVDKWKCTTAVSDFDCHFLVFLLLSSEQIRWKFVLWAIFWHHIAFVCWAGTTICLSDEYTLCGWNESCRYLGFDSNYVPVANEKVKTYTYKAVQLHVSRRMNLTHLEPFAIPEEETHTICHKFHWYVCFLISLKSWIWVILAVASKSPY